jgi:hypothetical protein
MVRLHVAALLFVSLGAFAQTQNWTITSFTEGSRQSTQRVEISSGGDSVAVKVYGEAALEGESAFDAAGNLLSLRSYAQGGECTLDLRTNGGRIRILSKDGEKSVGGQAPIVVSDPSSFLVFSLWLSRDPELKETIFSLYQPQDNRTVEMRLKYKGIETIVVGGKTRRARLLEMALSNPVAWLFWPHVYKYWYDADDFHFLAYEGLLGDGKTSRVENELR